MRFETREFLGHIGALGKENGFLRNSIRIQFKLGKEVLDPLLQTLSILHHHLRYTLTNELELLGHRLQPQVEITSERLALLLPHMAQRQQGGIESLGDDVPVALNVCRSLLHLEDIAQARDQAQVDGAWQAEGLL